MASWVELATTPATGDGELAGTADYLRVELTIVPAGYGATANDPPRRRAIGVVGFIVAGGRTSPIFLSWDDGLIGPAPAGTSGIYWQLAPGVEADLTTLAQLAATALGIGYLGSGGESPLLTNVWVL